jgi:hypothetical protein
MKSAAPNTPRADTGAREWPILILCGLAAMIPYVACHELFGQLFWFADELDLIDNFDRLGFWHWLWQAFAENFVPLFKLLWGGSVFVFAGSYAAMLTVMWLTHALNVALLGRLMRAAGLPWVAVFVAQLLFALTEGNIETLGWTVQWSAVLAVTFMLLALNSAFRSADMRAPIAWSAASALSFSRGVLTGFLAAGAFLWLHWGALGARPRRIAFACACVAPSVAVAVVIAVIAPFGNQSHMAGHWGAAAMFATWYYCVNPMHHLFEVDSWGPRTTIVLGLIKVVLVAWSLAQSRGRMRALFLVLLAFDLGNAALLGIGRYHTGLLATSSSRYQYASLIAVVPAVGFAFSRLWDRLPGPEIVRRLALAALFAAVGWSMCRQWSVDLAYFVGPRGTETRRILFSDPGPGPDLIPWIPGFPTKRAKDLAAKYNLH